MLLLWYLPETLGPNSKLHPGSSSWEQLKTAIKFREREKDVKAGPWTEVVVAAMAKTLAADLSAFSAYIGKDLTVSRKNKATHGFQI